MNSLIELAWPAARLGEALEVLGRRIGLSAGQGEPPPPPAAVVAAAGDSFDRWIETAAGSLGFEVEPVESAYSDLDVLVRRAAPAILRLPGDGEPRFLVVLASGRRASVLTTETFVVRVRPELIRDMLRRNLEVPCAGHVANLVAAAGVTGDRAQRLRQALFGELAGASIAGGCWLIRAPASAKPIVLSREAGLPALLRTMLAAHVLEYGLWILSWWILGKMTLSGRMDRGWLAAWLLILLTAIPFRLASTFAGGRLAIEAGIALRRRLLAAAFKVRPDVLRRMGAGQLLGRVIESEAVEQMALSGGLLALTALVELTMAALVLGAAAGAWLQVMLLIAWTSIVGVMGARYFVRLRRWTDIRLNMTNDLVERMMGHRTRLAQQHREHWNNGEDQALERYLDSSAKLDVAGASLLAIAPRGWLIVASLGLAPMFVFDSPTGLDATDLAIVIGGGVLAMRAFQSLAEGIERLAAAALAWDKTKIFWQADSLTEPVGDAALVASQCLEAERRAKQSPPIKRRAKPSSPTPNSATADPATSRLATATLEGACRSSGGGPPLVTARGLVFRYADRTASLLHDVDLRIDVGDRLLLLGSSGSGKSTLASILAGSRTPDGGLILCEGLDRETLGAAAWRRRIAMVSQFHENHVFMGTFAMNALLGRGWPPRAKDVQEAEAICRNLMLGPLLDRMPGGMAQMVGETGWQLSHGERSRLYIARALLQGADCIVLDESFGALDPETLEQAHRVVMANSSTLLVIAHP